MAAATRGRAHGAKGHINARLSDEALDLVEGLAKRLGDIPRTAVLELAIRSFAVRVARKGLADARACLLAEPDAPAAGEPSRERRPAPVRAWRDAG